MLISRRVAQFSIDNRFKNFQFCFSKNYIGIVSEEIEYKFSRALVGIINIEKKEKRA